MARFRLEEDLLGKKEVPEEAYYGVHTMRAIENFKISITKISDIPDFIKGMVWVKKAAALTNKELHVLPQDIADYIMQACDLILQEGRCLDQFPVDVFQGGAGTSVNMNTNEVIANLALELMGKPKGSYNIIHPNDHVNKCQSTNCAYPTGLHIAIYQRVLDLITHMEDLAKSFLELSKKYKDVVKMGRTQLQDAVPMTSGQEFYAFYSLLQGEIKNLRSVALSILEVNLGATAIGTSINAVPGFSELAIKHLAELTGFPCMQAEDLIEATSDCGSYVTLHGAIKGFAVKLSKICNDLRLLASGPRTALKEINLPEMQAGSSIMPAKVNPVIPEVVNQICFKVIGNDMTITLAAEAGQLQLNVMEPVIAQAMFESISLLINGLDTLRTKCIDGITVNTEICKRFVEKSIGLVTYLNPILGHHMGDIIGKECAASGKTVREVVLEKRLLSEAELDEIFSVENLIHPKYMGKKY